jgi:hypothetical protein
MTGTLTVPTLSTTGTPPLQVTSTTLVPNLNAGMVDGKHAAEFVLKAGDTMTGVLNLPANGLVVGTNQLVAAGGRIGIGTSTPNDQLEITGNLRLPTTTATTGIIMQGANTLVHTFGTDNFFAGTYAGNLTMTGRYNSASGSGSLYSNTTGQYNTASGAGALHDNTEGNYNTASGAGSLYSNTTGDDNTASGFQALNSNTTGWGNTASGSFALFYNTEGYSNTASGSGALYANFTGWKNTATGADALSLNTTGQNNTASGSQALSSNSTGWGNTAAGADALSFNTTGIYNTASGYAALYNSTTGNNNTAIGKGALSNNTTGSYNIGIGIGANVASGDLTNAIAIGADTLVTASDTVRIGNTFITHIGGQVGFSADSDIRIKMDIEEIGYGLAFIRQLRPVHYRLKNGNDRIDFGFIAQDIETLLGTEYNVLGIGGTEERLLSLRYTDFIAPMVKAMQEQQGIIEEQKDRIRGLEEKLRSQDERLARLEALLTQK